MCNKDLGKTGETIFEYWCTHVGLTTNKSFTDRYGWDYFVEFPHDYNSNVTEIHDSALECKVQVKSTNKRDRKKQITLSNLLRLCTDPLPTFFVFIEFDNEIQPQRYFVLHVDETIISKVLNRIHELKESSEDNNFNKRNMTIHYDHIKPIQQLDGTELKNVLTDYIGNISEYITTKNKYLENVGFEEGRGEVTFTVAGKNNLQKIIDMSLGVDGSVEISKIAAYEARFGIKKVHPQFESTVAMMEIKPTPIANGVLSFRKDNVSSSISFDSRLFVSALNKFTKNSLNYFRFECALFEIIFGESAKITFSIDNANRVNIKEIRNTLLLLKYFYSYGEKLFGEFVLEGQENILFDMNCKTDTFEYDEELSAIDYAITLISQFSVTDNVEIHWNELHQYRRQIACFYHVLNGSPDKLKLDFSCDPTKLDLKNEVVGIYFMAVPLGNHLLGIFLALVGNVEKTETSKLRLISEKANIEKKVVFKRERDNNLAEIQSIFKAIESKYDKSHKIVIMFDVDKYSQPERES